MWSESLRPRSCDKTGLRPTKTGLSLGLGLASPVLVLICVLQLWSWSCSFGLIDKQDHDFERSSVKIYIPKNLLYTALLLVHNLNECSAMADYSYVRIGLGQETEYCVNVMLIAEVQQGSYANESSWCYKLNLWLFWLTFRQWTLTNWDCAFLCVAKCVLCLSSANIHAVPL